MSSKHAVFLDTEVFKGPWFIQGKIPDVQTHFKSTKHSNTTLSVLRRALLKGEALRLIRTNSVKESLR